MVIELSSILEPDDFGPWFSRGHANEHNFVAQYVLVIEMRGLCYAGALKETSSSVQYPFINELDNSITRVDHGAPGAPLYFG